MWIIAISRRFLCMSSDSIGTCDDVSVSAFIVNGKISSIKVE